MFLKELNDGTKVRKRLLERLEQASNAHRAGRPEEVKRLLSVAIVGGGPTGVEFAAELADFINTDVRKSFPTVASEFRVSLIEALPGILPMFDKEIGQQVKDHLKSAGVEVNTETMVKGVNDTAITLARKGVEGTETLDYGALVWVAGIGARPITKKLAAAFGQSNPRGLEVDPFLRVKGANSNEVFALGDCTVSGYPWTAQVADQMGKYLGRVFRDEDGNAASPFKYDHAGSMAYVGQSQAVAALEPGNPFKDFAFWRTLASCPDALLTPENRSNKDAPKDDKPTKVNVTGSPGFAIWRGVYFTKMFSYANRYNVGTDWMRNFFFGRRVASSSQ